LPKFPPVAGEKPFKVLGIYVVKASEPLAKPVP
jgi:hypothetical protein